MAIAFDAASNASSTTGTSATSNAIVIGSGANRIVLAEVMIGSSTDVITAVTFGGGAAAMTRIGISAATADGQRVAFYYLVAPSSGSQTAAVTTSSSVRIDTRLASYTGVDQSNPINVATTNTASGSTSIATTVTPSIAGCWLVAALRDNADNSVTCSPGTMRDNGDGAKSSCIGDSNGIVSFGTGQTMTFSWSPDNTTSAVVLIALAPAPTAFLPIDWTNPRRRPFPQYLLNRVDVNLSLVNTTYAIAGVTKDLNGSPIASCTVKLFETATDREVQTTTSDGSGNYSFTVQNKITAYYVVAYKAGSPDVAGTTVNTLTGA